MTQFTAHFCRRTIYNPVLALLVILVGVLWSLIALPLAVTVWAVTFGYYSPVRRERNGSLTWSPGVFVSWASLLGFVALLVFA